MPSLVQIMACFLFGAKPLSERMLHIVNWTLVSESHWNLSQNVAFFIQENGVEISFTKMTSILSRSQGVNALNVSFVMHPPSRFTWRLSNDAFWLLSQCRVSIYNLRRVHVDDLVVALIKMWTAFLEIAHWNYYTELINTLRPSKNGRHFSRRHFQMNFLQWKCMNFT